GAATFNVIGVNAGSPATVDSAFNDLQTGKFFVSQGGLVSLLLNSLANQAEFNLSTGGFLSVQTNCDLGQSTTNVDGTGSQIQFLSSTTASTATIALTHGGLAVISNSLTLNRMTSDAVSTVAVGSGATLIVAAPNANDTIGGTVTSTDATSIFTKQ